MREYDLLHFDTNDSNAKFTTCSFDTTFTLNSAYKNIKRVSLKSLEMPIVFTNIRNDNTSNYIKMGIGPSNFTIVLPNTNYTSIQSLIADLNTYAVVVPALYRPVFSVVNTGITSVIRITFPSPFNFYILDSLLANTVLGFPKGSFNDNAKTGVASYVQGSYSYNLNYDNFVSLYLNIPSTNTSSGNRLISYKIPLNALQGMIFYLGQNNSFEQSVIISDPNYVLTSLKVQVFDRFGYPITNSVDYTFTLGFYYN